jgi:type I restriction enzyme, S subunit
VSGQALGDVADFYGGSSLPEGEEFSGQPGGYLLLRVSDLNLPRNSTYVTTGSRWTANRGPSSSTAPRYSLVIPKRGGAIGTNKKRILARDCILDPNLMAIHPHDDELDVSFLYHWFRTFDLLDITSGSAVPQLNKQDLRPLRLPLPSVEEQRRIAEILDQADALLAKRRQAISLLDDLGQSIFLEMFGDPASGAERWPVREFSSLVQEFRYGTSNKSASEGLPALRIPNVVGGKIDVDEIKLVPVTAAEEKRLRLLDGDLLFVRTNGNPDYVGRCAVFEDEDVERSGHEAGKFIFASYLIRARLKCGQAAPGFIQAFMSSNAGRKSLREGAKTSAGQFNINIEGIGSVSFPCPPMELQEKFEAKLRGLKELRQIFVKGLAELDRLFASLQARAFRGEL